MFRNLRSLTAIQIFFLELKQATDYQQLELIQGLKKSNEENFFNIFWFIFSLAYHNKI